MYRQRALTASDRAKLSARAARRVLGTDREGMTCQCGSCSALYVYRDGFSTFLCYGSVLEMVLGR